MGDLSGVVNEQRATIEVLRRRVAELEGERDRARNDWSRITTKYQELKRGRECLEDATSLQSRVVHHHRQQFGRVTLEKLAVKLGEESGEVCGAIIRQVEFRDGRCWDSEIVKEVGHVVTVLRVICDRMGRNFEAEVQLASEEFLSRTWDNVEKEGGSDAQA